MKRAELVICFETEDEANRFVEKHIVHYSDEPMKSPEVIGYALYGTEYPENKEGPALQTLRSSFQKSKHHKG